MKNNFENNKHNKDGPVRKNNVLSVPYAYENNTCSQKFLKKGFVAWPDGQATSTKKNTDRDIIVGRTKSGGYVAYPKQAIVKASLDVYYPKRAC